MGGITKFSFRFCGRAFKACTKIKPDLIFKSNAKMSFEKILMQSKTRFRANFSINGLCWCSFRMTTSCLLVKFAKCMILSWFDVGMSLEYLKTEFLIKSGGDKRFICVLLC